MVPPVFSLNHLAGKPTNNCSSGEPRNEFNEFHLLSPFGVLYNSGLSAVVFRLIGFQRPLKKQLLAGRDGDWLHELLIPGQIDAMQFL